MECDLKPWEVEELLDFLITGMELHGEICEGLARLIELLQDDCQTIHLNKVR
jgi:hypothetical protein